MTRWNSHKDRPGHQRFGDADVEVEGARCNVQQQQHDRDEVDLNVQRGADGHLVGVIVVLNDLPGERAVGPGARGSVLLPLPDMGHLVDLSQGPAAAGRSGGSQSRIS